MQGKGKQHTAAVVEACHKLTRKRACRTTSKPNWSLQEATFDRNMLRERMNHGRSAGIPRMHWSEEAAQQIQNREYLKQDIDRFTCTVSDDGYDDIMIIIKQHAKDETTSTPNNQVR